MIVFLATHHCFTFQDAETYNRIDLQLIQKILLDMNEAQGQIEQATQHLKAKREDNLTTDEENLAVANLESAGKKLSTVHEYLMVAFEEEKLDLVLHRAKVGNKAYFWPNRYLICF